MSTPSDVSILDTPPARAAPPSSFSRALQSKTAIERSRLFLQGRHEELLGCLDIRDKKWVHSAYILIAPLKRETEFYQLGSTNIGTSVSRQRNIGVLDLGIGKLMTLDSPHSFINQLVNLQEDRSCGPVLPPSRQSHRAMQAVHELTTTLSHIPPNVVAGASISTKMIIRPSRIPTLLSPTSTTPKHRGQNTGMSHRLSRNL